MKAHEIANKEELIKALRWCGDESNDWCFSETYKCPLWNEDRVTDECKAELMLAAADALEAAEKRIAELEARLPKEGEWLRTDAFPHRIYCSVCYKTYVPNDRWQIWVDDELPRKYCPNCGSRMPKGEQE